LEAAMTERRERENHSEIRDALRALLSDIETMYEGAELLAEYGQREEFFGPFSVSKMSGSGMDADVSVSWPNLAISMRQAKSALRDGEL
jgi:hypothetical protein